MTNKMLTVDAVKWLATVIQLIGYGMTGMNLVPYNIVFLLYRHLSLVCCWIYVERQSDNGSPHWGVCFAASWLS